MEKTLSNVKKAYEDGLGITYVNVEVDDGSETAKLMKYFKTADPYDMSQGDLSKRVHFLKCEEEGKKIMCKVTEQLIDIGKEIGAEDNSRKIVLRMAKKGLKATDIVDLTGVAAETARNWVEEAGIAFC